MMNSSVDGGVSQDADAEQDWIISWSNTAKMIVVNDYYQLYLATKLLLYLCLTYVNCVLNSKVRCSF